MRIQVTDEQESCLKQWNSQINNRFLQKYNFPDTVIWNPWIEKAKEIPDFGDDEYPNMICVESGHVSTPVVLMPGTAFEASQILQVM